MTGTDPAAAIDEFDQALAIGREIGDAEAVALWSANLVDALIRLGRLDEAAAIALEAAHTGAEAGALRNEVGLTLINGAQALFLGGRWDECEDVLERLPAQRAGGVVELGGSRWRRCSTRGGEEITPRRPLLPPPPASASITPKLRACCAQPRCRWP